YELLKDYKALNTVRELLVIIRMWGLVRESCLPVFFRSADNLDVLALLYRLLSKLVQCTDTSQQIDDGLIVFSETWPHTWPYFYWTVALLIWLVLMIIFIIIWRYRKNSQNKSNDIQSSTLISKPQLINNDNSQEEEEEENENVKLFEVRNDKKSVIIPGNLRENRPKLSPLIIIHQNMSDNDDNERSGDVEIVDEIDDDIPDTANPNRISQSVNRSSIKDYLKIVTVDSPSPEIQDDNDDDDDTSPPRPLSPRELFFIDLIRGAKKTTKNPNEQRPYRGSYFFGEDNKSSEIPKDNRRYTMGDNQFRKLLSTNAIKMEELKSASKENVSKSDSKISKVLEENEEQLNTLNNCDDNVAGGSEYFIADVVDSPSIKKAEIFLQIEPTDEDPDADNQND
ncbi:hypothetical protein PV326_013444, partial [Microctonus aethiopoides]